LFNNRNLEETISDVVYKIWLRKEEADDVGRSRMVG